MKIGTCSLITHIHSTHIQVTTKGRPFRAFEVPHFSGPKTAWKNVYNDFFAVGRTPTTKLGMYLRMLFASNCTILLDESICFDWLDPSRILSQCKLSIIGHDEKKNTCKQKITVLISPPFRHSFSYMETCNELMTNQDHSPFQYVRGSDKGYWRNVAVGF